MMARQETWQLPIGKSPVVSYLHHAFPLSILANQPTFCDDWIFNNYVQLQAAETMIGGKAGAEFDFYLGPTHFASFAGGLFTAWIPPSLLWRTRSEILPVLVELMRLGRYVQITVDEYFVPNRAAFGRVHFMHELMVVGLNPKDETASILGFNEKFEFAPSQIPLSSLLDSIERVDLTDHYIREGVRIFQLRSFPSYKASPETVIVLLDEYLQGIDSSIKTESLAPPRPGLVFGLAVYTPILHWITSLNTNPDSFDIRPFQVLWEHKSCMKKRLDRLIEMGLLAPNNILVPQFDQILTLSNTLRLLALKFIMTKKPSILERLADGIESLVRDERHILTTVLESLRSSKALRFPRT